MKFRVKAMFMIAIAMFLLIGIIGCTQNEEPDSKYEQGDKSESQNASNNEKISENDEITEGNGEDESTGSEDKLVPNPSVSLEENYDYLTIDVPAEDFELEDLEGNTVKLSDYEGQIVFLNFWATWCPPCRKEMPDMEEIHKEYGDKGVAILAVNSTGMELRGGTDSEKAARQVKEFISDNGFTFSILLDSNDEVVGKYNKILPITGIPTTFMIDKNGQIRYARPGAFLSKEQIEAFIALLDE